MTLAVAEALNPNKTEPNHDKHCILEWEIAMEWLMKSLHEATHKVATQYHKTIVLLYWGSNQLCWIVLQEAWSLALF